MERSNWEDNIGTIKEIYPGHYQIILDFATNNVLKYLLNDNYAFVWVHKHNLENYWNWKMLNLPITDGANYDIRAKNIEFDFIISTKEFRSILPDMSPGVHLVQLNEMPGHYLDLTRITGKTRYDLLKKECDYLFEVEIPSATDYGTLVSSDKNWLTALLNNDKIDWCNLP